MAQILFNENAVAPSTPPANEVTLYAKTDGNLYSKDPAGNERLVTTGSSITALTGDVTGTGPGITNTTIAVNSVTNAKLAREAPYTIKGNNTGVAADVMDLDTLILGTPAFQDSGIVEQLTSYTPAYIQEVIQNTQPGPGSSADYIAANDLGTEMHHYIDLGINSSTFSGPSAFYLANGGYIFVEDGDLALGTDQAHAVHLLANNSATDAITINAANQLIFPGLTGYVKANGAGILTASATVPSADLATVGIAQGGTGQTTQSAALTALAGTQVSGQYLRSNGTNTALSAIQAADVPTLNQNTSGSSASCTGNAATVSNGVYTTGDQTIAGNKTFSSTIIGSINGSSASCTGNAATATTATTAGNVSGVVAIANGGTGQTSASNAITALLPSQTGNAGTVLGTNGTAASWGPVPLNPLSYFGAGSDGNVVISSGTTTLTRDMYYNNLTLSGTGKINTAGFRIFGTGTLDLTAGASGCIYSSAGNGGAGSSTGTGGSVGTGATGVTIGAGASGNNGGAGGTGAGGGGGGGAVGNNGGTSGNTTAAGTGSNGSGAIGHSANASTNTLPVRIFLLNLLRGVLLITGGSAGYAGGGGGGDGSVNGGGGGGSAGGGGIIFLSFATINRGAGTAAGAIAAIGGNGGNGGAPTTGTAGGGGAGGSGGGGGWIYLVYGTLTGTTATGCLDVTGGNGGAGGNGTYSSGGGGGSGGAGSGGRVTILNLSSSTSTETTFSNNVAGTAGSGSTGATATIATTSQVNL